MLPSWSELRPLNTHKGATAWIRPVKSLTHRGNCSRFAVKTATLCGAGFDPNPKSPKKKPETVIESGVTDLDDSEIEARLLQRRQRRRSGTEQGEDSAFKVDKESVPDDGDKELETTIIYVLASLFGLILLNGLVIAASGFLPEEVDSFVEKILYPSFTPVVGVFLVCSTLYGIWKTRSGKA